MKAALAILILGLIFLHGEALKCRRSNCSGVGNCASFTTTCPANADRCFSMIMTMGYRVTLTRGCATQVQCATMKAVSQTSCCSTDLCN